MTSTPESNLSRLPLILCCLITLDGLFSLCMEAVGKISFLGIGFSLTEYFCCLGRGYRELVMSITWHTADEAVLKWEGSITSR